MFWILLSVALAHAPVHETLGQLDVSAAPQARRAAHLHLHQAEAAKALAVLLPEDRSVQAELLRAEAGTLLQTADARAQLDAILSSDTAQPAQRARALDLRAALHADPIAAWHDLSQAVLLEPTPGRALAAAVQAPHPSAAVGVLVHSRGVLGSSVSLDHALAHSWLELGAPESALAVLEGATGATTEGRLLRAQAHSQAGRVQQALELRTDLLADLERRLTLRDSPLLHLARARCLLALDRTSDARAVLQQVVIAAPELASARALLDSLEPA